MNETPREIVEYLRRRRGAAPDLFLKLLPGPESNAPANNPESDFMREMPFNHQVMAALKTVILSKVIAEVATKNTPLAIMPRSWRVHSRAAELGHLLIAADQQAALELIREVHDGDDWVAPLYPTLFEPAARTLGDRWNGDVCTEFDVTLGLWHQQPT